MDDKQKKKIQDKRIEDAQRRAIAELKVFNKDFYEKLPEEIREVMWRLIDRWSEYDWFDKAWNEYRNHVLEASKNGHKIRAPGFIFNKHIGEQVAKNIRREDALWDTEMKVLHSEDFLDNVLKHHGIKGQKWYVRRYQNEDGTLTEEGKKRYTTTEGKGKSKTTIIPEKVSDLKGEALDKYNKDISTKYLDRPQEVVNNGKSFVDNLANIFRNRERGSKRVNDKDYSKIGDDELRKRINRMSLERQYGELSGDTKYVQTGKEKTMEILQTIGAVLAVIGTGIGIGKTIYDIKKGD